MKGKKRGWEGRVAKCLKEGFGGIHKWVKREPETEEKGVHRNGFFTAAPADIVEEDFKSWKEIWEKLRRWESTPWKGDQARKICGEGEALPKFGAKELRRAAASFSVNTGWGVDNLGPRQFMWLSDELLNAIAVFLLEIETVGSWPQQLQEALVHLIPKPTGGRRPIGLVASLPRLWDRVRRPVLQGWRNTCQREYNWMCRGKGAARAIWAQSVEEEAAKFEAKKSTVVLIDLVKAFEQVTLGSVWEAGVRANFPSKMLRLAMEMCMAKRRLVYKRAASKECVVTKTAILAGPGVATDLIVSEFKDYPSN